ncbi:MAG: hypothetical protein PHN63_03785, partial [Candidatus Omnitrophica bacterium]|nr:hypothetical protein [Candidatus Omnitrophota bacterium]
MKKILIISFVIILAVSAGVYYVNRSVLPARIKTAIVAGLEDATGKKVLIGSVRFNILKGLILEDLIIRDDLNAIVNVKKAYCRFFIIPLIRKQIIISRILLESPDIFVERRPDNSVNLIDLFGKERMAKADFKAFIHKIKIKKATVNFHDLTLDPLFTEEIKDLDAEVYFQPP